MQSKEYLIDAFYNDDGRNISISNSLINDLELYLAEKGTDAQLELILYTLRSCNDDFTDGVFTKSCEFAAPAIKILKKIEWGLFELDIISTIIGYIESYTHTIELTKKALNVLDNKFTDSNHYDPIKQRIYFNLSLRLLREKYIGKSNPEEVVALFDESVKICKKMPHLTYRAVIMVREAIFSGDYDKISDSIKALENTEDKTWIKTTKDEVVEYLYFIDEPLPTKMINFVIGHQIRRRRKEIGMTALDFGLTIGVSLSAIHQIERGDKGIRPKRMFEIAKTLSVDTAYLLGNISVQHIKAVDDPIIHTITTLLATLTDKDKKFTLDFIHSLIEHNKDEDA